MSIRFIDLFCGIGGFHQAIKQVDPTSTCILASDIDSNARTVYELNHGVKPVGDIKDITPDTLPAFDLLCGGFPCQAFSIAQWKDAKAFDDPRGTLFFEILRILDQCTPRCVLLENVANLVKINNGEVFRTIVQSLETRGYIVSHAVLSPHQFGIPQNRERVYIVASRGGMSFNFNPLKSVSSSCTLAGVLENAPAETHISPEKYVLLNPSDVKKQAKSGLQFCGYLRGELRKVGTRENTEHLSRVHKQLMRIYSSNGTHPTLAASETSGRYHIYDETRGVVRRLTLDECYRLMAYPTTFQKSKNRAVAYKQIGNSVCVRVVEQIVREMIKQGVVGTRSSTS